jgi:hypothetical protein
MLPFPQTIEDERMYRSRDCIETIAKRLGRTDDELAHRLPSGEQTVFPQPSKIGP